MDYFSLCLGGFCLTGQSLMHMGFVSRITGKRPKIGQCAVYLVLLCMIEWFSVRLALPGILAIGMELFVLSCTGRLLLGNPWPVSWAAAVFAIYISQFSFGIVNSAEAMIFPCVVGTRLLYLLVIFATLVSFAVCTGCYAAVQKFLSLAEDGRMPCFGVLLFPGMFFFAAELYILHTSYSILQPGLSLEMAWAHSALLVLQVLGLAALLCTLYAWQRLCHSLQAQAELRSLTQAARAQKTYIAEAQIRYGQTRAFRHDIKNHLSVLGGLLNSGKLDESKAYLQKLETASGMLSFPCQTGNPVVDILLGEKLGLAKTNGISAEAALLLPRPCRADDFDLCVIFANALDNAICACQAAKGEKTIRVSGKRQGEFYMLLFENTCLDGPLPPAGTGLSNIRSVAEKYHGEMLIEKTGQRFSLSVLLNIS